MPEAEVAIAEAASTMTRAASIETRLMEAPLMERRRERMTEAASAGWGSEPAPARPKGVSRRPTRREAAAATGRCHGPTTTTTCVTLSLRWNQRQEHGERRNG
jgi:hypothetical protein